MSGAEPIDEWRERYDNMLFPVKAEHYLADKPAIAEKLKAFEKKKQEQWED